MIDPYSTDVLWVVIVGFIIAFILAFGIGANSVPNSFATSVGSKVLTLRQACCLGTVCEIAGSVLLGYKVSGTVRKGVLQLTVYEGAELELMLGMFAVLISSSVLLLIAIFLKLPVSATHGIVGATLGFSLVCRGNDGINWGVLGLIVGSWFLSPVLSGVISVSLFALVRHFILNAPNPIVRGLLSLPIIYGVTVFINVFSIFLDGPTLLYFDRIPWWATLIISLCCGAVTMLTVQLVLVPFMKRKLGGQSETGSTQKTRDDEYKVDSSCTEVNGTLTGIIDNMVPPAVKMVPFAVNSEGPQTTNSNEETEPPGAVAKHGQDNLAFSLSSDNGTGQPTSEDKAAPPELFSFLQILAATFSSFARGGNDVSNAIGPVIALWLIYTEGSVQQKEETPIYILFYGGIGMSVGLWVYGQRVMKTIGEDLTKIAASTGFTIEIGAALTVLLASKIGMPISTTHCLVGSVVFVGWANATKEGVDWKLFRNIVVAWLVTVPVSGLLSAAVIAILREVAL
ncbi:sodium-dependent phosphate transporter 2-like isoform X1 [Zootermopsis nevadensis]|uniref:sodium-dependent phosphate transporter 2-like isoform X1 n=1 Tax=Zootermopsis nevadensis TaxID=136037 RepID=UPI000B8E4966|nr:sodium-dependent phosphate transporter 2-like isoform X1 [Zootermopsis nevadensis]XP_021930097.1 sodium-dependent phosphate transporter 2-like isoform X1 [Zootermopsis nevadensis]XP_021930098.1 sodium-dependent phosphate transporter 2-like isoform X1 [Zootermopsis nevadensis]XP_021930099.1 sodium-dependent phosphate transporter 2-like isoform X1 [Zootermopsis nevadensis]